MIASTLLSTTCPQDIHKDNFRSILVTYKCCKKINKPAGASNVHIYLFTVPIKILIKIICQDTCSDRYLLSYHSTSQNCKSCTKGMSEVSSKCDTYHILQQRENPKHYNFFPYATSYNVSDRTQILRQQMANQKCYEVMH
jgi:hypothetical protein